jgi:hypothetical protein
MENDGLTESIKNKWLVILSELEKVSRVAWLAYYDSFPLKIENNVLVVGVSDRSKRMMASEEKHLNNFRKILLAEMNLDLSIEILFIEDEKLVEKIKNSIVIIPQTKINEAKTSAPIAKMKEDKSVTPKINKASIKNMGAGKPRNEIFSPGMIILTGVIVFGILFNIAMSLSNFIGDFSTGGGGSSYSGASNDSTESVPTQETICKNLKSDINSYESRMNQINKDFKDSNANIAKSDESFGEALQEIPGLNSIWSDYQLWIKYTSEYKLILQENSYEAKEDEISIYLNNIIEALSARIKLTQMQPSPEKGDLSDKLIGLDRDSFRAQSEINKICDSPLFPG